MPLFASFGDMFKPAFRKLSKFYQVSIWIFDRGYQARSHWLGRIEWLNTVLLQVVKKCSHVKNFKGEFNRTDLGIFILKIFRRMDREVQVSELTAIMLMEVVVLLFFQRNPQNISIKFGQS